LGEKYKDELEQKIRQFGGENLRVYINAEGVHPHYYEHLTETFKGEGVQFVSSRKEANFVFEGSCEPSYEMGQIVAFFNQDQSLSFAGAL
jgi:hypothetical protein